MKAFNKKIFGIFLIFALFLIDAKGQQTNWLWANSVGEIFFSETGRSIDIDLNGNIFVVGYFQSPSITFGNFILQNADQTGYSYDIFIVKYSPTGNVLWAKRAGGNTWDEGYGVCTDSYGNAIITGRFQSDSITFDNYTLINEGGSDIFLTKFDPMGNVIWAKRNGGNSFERGYAVNTDADDNILLTGMFFSPSIVFGNDTIVRSGNNDDVFIAKYDSSGNPLWARSAQDAVSNGVSTDAQGNIVMSGWFNGTTITFDNNVLTNTSNSSDIFIVKYDAYGNVLWAKSAGGTNEDKCIGITIDAYGNTFITGFFKSSSIIFGNDTLTNVYYTGYVNDVFVAKYDSLGNVVWAKSTGGTGGDEGWSIDTDVSGNVWITGFTNNTDILIAAYNTIGNLILIDSVGTSNGGQMGYGIKSDGSGNLFLTGWYNSPTIAFGTNILNNSDNTGNSSDIYVAKLNYVVTTLHESHNLMTTNIFPNPFSNQLTFTFSDNIQTTVFLYNFFGQQVLQQTFTNTMVINTAQLASGIYFYELRSDKQIIAIGKVVKY
ncbi:MAG: T9SS type A sorting domain-containing protein [Vicingaceae bacterium]|nr:T9SS type A sorting domain-containing protein [Vicingaceae bacterium]